MNKFFVALACVVFALTVVQMAQADDEIDNAEYGRLASRLMPSDSTIAVRSQLLTMLSSFYRNVFSASPFPVNNVAKPRNATKNGRTTSFTLKEHDPPLN